MSGTGLFYRTIAEKLAVLAATPVQLEVPLAEFPMQIGNWSGKDVKLSEEIIEIAGNDDYVARDYFNIKTSEKVNLYIAYSARPRTMRGHKPEICYPGNGWIHDSSKNVNVNLKSGKQITCRVHKFHKPTGIGGEIVVLNFYILNGRLVIDENAFSGLNFRTVNFSRDSGRYVSQIQISSGRLDSVVSAASEFAGLILKYFPGTNQRLVQGK